LTPEGIQEKLRIIRSFLARREEEFVALKKEIAGQMRQVRNGK
jgi:hypothetical protein